MNESLYSLLGVPASASADDIRKAYRALARKLHPDVNPGDAAAEDRFKRVAAAYDVLSDKKRRADYDEFGDDALKGGFDPEKARAYQSWKSARHRGAQPFTEASGGSPFSGPNVDFDLGDLFGFGRQRQQGPIRGHDIRAVVDMDLPQAIAGGHIEISVPERSAPVKVKIPPGADTGSTIRLAGKGGAGISGGPRGDLVIETRVRKHPRVTRRGLDLTIRVPVSLAEAYNGAKIDVPTFDGSVVLSIPPRSQPGAKLRLRGKGVARKKKRGDLFIVLDVKLPDREDAALAKAIAESEAAYATAPRKDFVL